MTTPNHYELTNKALSSVTGSPIPSDAYLRAQVYATLHLADIIEQASFRIAAAIEATTGKRIEVKLVEQPSLDLTQRVKDNYGIELPHRNPDGLSDIDHYR